MQPRGATYAPGLFYNTSKISIHFRIVGTSFPDTLGASFE
jgi:hypothetical protein